MERATEASQGFARFRTDIIELRNVRHHHFIPGLLLPQFRPATTDSFRVSFKHHSIAFPAEGVLWATFLAGMFLDALQKEIFDYIHFLQTEYLLKVILE